MKGIRKLPDIGTDLPSMAQDFLVVVKKMLTAERFPQTDKILLYNATTGLTDWVSITSSLTVSGGASPVLGVTNPGGSSSTGEAIPVGAVVLTTGADPSTIYGYGTWTQL